MRTDNKDIFNKKLFIYASIAVISSLHFLTTIKIYMLHDVYQRLYYIPIIFASVWFGVRGGITTSAVISMIYFIHIIFSWKLNPDVSLQKFLETIIFNLVALVTGFLTEREQKLKNKYHETAGKLKESYEKLKKQTREMIEIEEQLRKTDKLTMLGQISAELAHEIRNPLSSIKGTIEIIKSDYDPENKKYEFIEILTKETNRLSNTLNNYLNFTKEKTLFAVATDVNALIHEVKKLLNLNLKKNKITVKTDLTEDIPKIELEGEQLKQVFLNVIINAIQAMPKGGQLKITTRTENMTKNEEDKTVFLYIDFMDNGIGIEANKIEDLFKPFYTSKEEGTGLGLSISQKIIEKFDGKILVKSEVNKGSVFTVKLPYKKRNKYEKEEDINN